MTKKLLLFLILILSMAASQSSSAKSAVSPDTISARRAFVEIPATVLDLLSKSTRLDMLDFWDVDSVYNAVNQMEGLSHLNEVTPDFLEVVITPVSTMQFKILKDKKGNDLVMTIYTVGGGREAKDSEIKFYDTSLQELDSSKLLELPELKEFFEIPRSSITKMKEIEEMIPFYTVCYQAAPGVDTVTGKLTIGQYMSEDDYHIVKLFEKPEIKMVWDGKKLKPSK